METRAVTTEVIEIRWDYEKFDGNKQHYEAYAKTVDGEVAVIKVGIEHGTTLTVGKDGCVEWLEALINGLQELYGELDKREVV